MPRYLLILLAFSAWLAPANVLTGQSELIISSAIRIGDTVQLHVLHLDSGDRLLGHVLQVDSAAVLFRFRESAATNRFDRERVRYIGLTGEAPPRPSLSLPDSSYSRRGRYLVNVKEPFESLFYFRTAFDTPTRTTYRNWMLAFNEFNLRLNEHIDVGGVAVLPIVLGLRLRYHTRVASNLHLGVANDNFFVFANGPAGAHLIYPIVSVGVPAQHLNYGLGYVLAYDDFDSSLNPFFTLGGSLQFAPRWRMMGNFFYLFNEFDGNTVIPQVMFTHLRFRHRFDFGVIPIFDGTFPFIPAFSYSLYF
jgi:hypothetical protein